MKILAVLALLITLSSAYVDWTYDSIANGTQSEGYTSDSPGTCTISQKYVATTNTLSGTFTCSGLNKNVTAAHIHDCGSLSSVTTTTGNVLADCSITVNADGLSGTFNCVFKDTTTIDAICNDQCYWNFHTDYDTLGEVRANLVNMRSICNLGGIVTLDGSVTTVGNAPDTGIRVPDFYVGFIGATLKGTGGAYFVLSWDSVNQVLTVSGCTYGLTSDIDYMYAYYTDDDGTSFYTVSVSTFPTGRPFSFRSYYISHWILARFTSSKSNIVIQTYTNTAGEIQADLVSTDFPSFSGNCVPYTGLKYDATKVLNCQYGSDSYSYDYACPAGYYCAISDLETKFCSTQDYCYNCDCGAAGTDLPSTGYACCDFDNCNKLSLALLSCITGSGSTISVGVFISLFAVLFMKWFN